MAASAETTIGFGGSVTDAESIKGGPLLNAPDFWKRTTAIAVVLGVVCSWSSFAAAQAPDSLLLQAPTGVKMHSVYQAGSKRFVNYILWDDIPDNIGTSISKPTPWATSTPPNDTETVVESRGLYNGDIDRTVVFTADDSGMVGVDLIRIRYDIRQEEEWGGRITLQPSYVPGTWLPVIFRTDQGGVIDYGLQVRFSAGWIEIGGVVQVAMEDFEGFHVWRGIERDGSDLTIVAELSKQEAFLGDAPGGALLDSVYYYDVIPTLRQHRDWLSPFGAIDCVGTRFTLDLEPDQYFWYDCNASNGFTYYYAVTTFDRGYEVASSQQGLEKFDNCTVAKGQPFQCPSEMVQIEMEVAAQNDLYNVYVVPNPYRSGGSRLTSENYHNFPDELVRFVNVPSDCTIKIFTVAGDLVWENEQTNNGGNVTWDLKNRGSESVTSGVYIYRIEKSDGDSVFGRIVVIR